mgnify:CR=1 FL=1
MQTAYVINAEMIDNQTIHIYEPLELKNKKIIVTIQTVENIIDKKSGKENFLALAGKIDIDADAIREIREDSII